MKRFIYLLIIINSFASLAQEIGLSKLENQRRDILNQINLLSDSIKKIELEISAIKLIETKKMITDSSLRTTVFKGAKLKENPDLEGDLITTLSEGKEVTILDFTNDYFKACTDSVCGYINEMWVKNNLNKLNEFKKEKKLEEGELLRLEREREIKEQRIQLAKLEKEKDAEYSKKYGQETYQKLKEGYYWIGMNKEMATISIGTPNDINKSVGSWGVHEQWVYDSLNLYFEDGILTSYTEIKT
ncbi:unnamed protein product [Chrysoparadoxa australica]